MAPAPVTSSYSSTVLADQPDAYYRLDETAGNIAHDSSGNHYDAALQGSYTLKQPGLIVNDTDTAIAFGANGTLAGAKYRSDIQLDGHSVEFWVSLNDGSGVQHIVATCGETNYTSIGTAWGRPRWSTLL